MKVVDQRHLPDERPATMDETGKRLFVFPAQVKGFWRSIRNYVEIFLVVLFLVLPWINIGGHQALLLDIGGRQFSIFGLTFWAHDGPLVFFVLALLCLGLAFITAVWGRVWCGWACPQTVFIDGVFRRLEYWIIGSHIQQKNLAKAPWDIKKFFKLSVLWTLFTVASLIIAHSFLAYFIGADRLVDMTLRNPYDNWTIFIIMFFLTAVIVFDFGWFREQFCLIVCPYGRFQSVLMDDDSITVSYDPLRGEPRRGEVPKGEQQGDCISCYKCVVVCPTGIDIREGMQMECIACTACIDACDEVMDKIDKPHGLIRYASGKNIKGIVTSWFKPRVVVYSLLLIAVTAGLITAVSSREDIDVTVLRGKDSPYKILKNEGSGHNIILNHFKLHMKNQTFDPVSLEMVVPKVWKVQNVELVTQMPTISLEPGKDVTIHVFIKFPQELTGSLGTKTIKLDFINLDGSKIDFQEEVKLVGPKSI